MTPPINRYVKIPCLQREKEVFYDAKWRGIGRVVQ